MPKQLPPAQLELIKPISLSLNNVAHEVKPDEILSDYTQKVIDRMLELSAGKGHSEHDSRQMVGLAAVQLGVGIRVITIDITADGSLKNQTLHVFINPRITERSKEIVDGREGCWSCGNICGNVPRSKSVAITALDRHGKPVTAQFTGFTARIAQHEIDHLDGIRFPDRIPPENSERLHWVEPSQFPEYRVEWEHWPYLCSRSIWEEMKAGIEQ